MVVSYKFNSTLDRLIVLKLKCLKENPFLFKVTKQWENFLKFHKVWKFHSFDHRSMFPR
jgi:hypothetical protein